MQAIAELGDNAEIAASTAQSPEEVGVFRFAGMHGVALGGY